MPNRLRISWLLSVGLVGFGVPFACSLCGIRIVFSVITAPGNDFDFMTGLRASAVGGAVGFIMGSVVGIVLSAAIFTHSKERCWPQR
jgi:hypothetical protein